jgi:predicted DNA-binding helix-hairpin-helix protein
MVCVVSKPGTLEKLEILSADAQYDLACACGTRKEEHRSRGEQGKWIYPVTLASGGKASLFRTLLSNGCVNDCKYCPLRANRDVRRCALGPDEAARTFMEYIGADKVFGMFLTSGVTGSADTTMERLNTTAAILRKKHQFRGYIHLKVIPGASDAAIEEALSLSTAVSINIETPGAGYFSKLSTRKNYELDIIRPLQTISQLTAKGAKFEGKALTTQFIVGAAGERDSEIVRYTAALYDRLKLHRVYFSSYQRGLGDNLLPGENSSADPQASFVREHRLYQVDFLLRRYGFRDGEFAFDSAGNLDLESDPKETWAKNHPEAYPIRVNRASRFELLRVPGLGPTTVKRILEIRRECKLHTLSDVGKVGARLSKASNYLRFD